MYAGGDGWNWRQSWDGIRGGRGSIEAAEVVVDTGVMAGSSVGAEGKQALGFGRDS